jgi:N-methylhydantoinase A
VSLIGIDVGGTFTDGVLLGDGPPRMAKVPTRPGEEWRSVLEIVDSFGVDMADTSVRHGTTIVTNAVLERKGARTALVTTRGHRDVLEIQRGVRTDLYDLQADKPVPLVPRRLRFEIDERVNWRGDVLRGPDEDEIAALAEELRAAEVEAVAICFLHSYLNAVNERVVGDGLRALLPDVDISLSAEVSPQFREYERSCTVVVNAFVKRKVAAYHSRLADALRERNYTRELLIMQSNGGMAPPSSLIERPVHAVLSGVAAGSMAAAYVGQLVGSSSVIGLDVGGTSADVSIAVDGAPELAASYEVETGVSLQVPSRSVHTIGAGGGSIGWIDGGGRLRVGPRSAGANPGPACYGRGGTEPTVTDANLVLGRLDPDYFLGGQMAVSAEAAREALEGLEVPGAEGLDVDGKALGMLRIVDANMMEAIRLITVRRGYDLRDFVLVAFGGAGPLHATSIARDLNIPKVVVFPHPGVLSALGLLVVDVRHDLARTLLVELDAEDGASLEGGFAALEAEARGQLEQDGFTPADMVIERSVDVRYSGQSFEITVPIGSPADASTLAAARAAFDAEHLRLRGHAAEDDTCEIVNVRVSGVGLTARAPMDHPTVEGSLDDAIKGTRQVNLGEPWGWTECSVYQRELIPPGSSFAGPALIEELDSTTIAFPGWVCAVDDHGILTVSIDSQEAA